MFAHFFISPLMKADALDRELSAIESEFSQATQNDQVRLQQVLCDTAPSEHPYSRFGWGNELSLKGEAERAGIDVRSEIRAFYDRFYSANLMKLVVCGEDSLDVLEQWVTASYSSIPNKDIPRPDFASVGFPFGEGVDPSPMLCRIIPVRDIHTLHLEWMVPPVFGHHHQKPADYVASLIGHESEGSLLSHVRMPVISILRARPLT
jgi:nardilysin